MYIKKINKGGSLLACAELPKEGKNLLKGVYRWTGTVYHVPSLKYLLESSDASDDTIDTVMSYFENLSVGSPLPWAVKTDESVYYTQDRDGNTLPEPRKSTRLYADINLEQLESAIADATAPAKTTRSRQKA
jgi:hypothetical protein